MELTNEELSVLHECVYYEVYYGDDSVVYEKTEYGNNLRNALAKIEEEMTKRGQ